MNILEAMKLRRSVRSFNGEALSAEERAMLLSFADRVENPFGGRFAIRLKSFDYRKGYRPSTYGMIKGASDFLLVVFDDSDESAFAVGFCFEQLVLKARQMGLGTCWIAATFKGSDFATDEPWPEGEKLKIVCPVGVAADKRLIEKIAGFALGSRKRKDFSKLFFCDGFSRPLMRGGRFDEALEMLRIAPSSTNSQPWRALVDGNTVHFYYEPKSALSILDCGIGICHFYETEKFYGRKGEFFKMDGNVAAHDKLRYLLSYRADE